MQRQMEVCPEHGLILAQRKTIPTYLNLLVFVLSLGHASWDLPFRCPKCGKMTEPQPHDSTPKVTKSPPGAA